MSLKKPLLAETIESNEDLSRLKYPVYVSPKIDGIRCLVNDEGMPYSRKGEPFRNQYFLELFEMVNVQNIDGELTIGSPLNPATFGRTSGWLRRDYDDKPEFKVTYWIFDKISQEGFATRLKWLEMYAPLQVFGENLELKLLPQYLCHIPAEVMWYEQKFVNEGYEGIMIRGDIDKVGYKHGRGTWNSQELFKFKRFEDTEGVIVGLVQAEQNNNEATKDAFGRTKRSSSKKNKSPLDMMGKFLVESPRFPSRVVGSKDGPLKIGTGEGLTDDLRKKIWADYLRDPASVIGRVITFQYQGGSDYEGPRFPSYKGFRDDGI